MAITEQDIKLLKAARMTDNADGGGAMTANVVQSGQDNNLFDDVSNLARVYGNVSLRKLFSAVLTNTTDKYLGARVIIDQPAEDPYIESTLFEASSLFDTRDKAKQRVEAYLSAGTPYQGLLYGPHIEGMMSVALIQQEDRPLPGIGDVFILRQELGAVATEQFTRVTGVSAAVYTFTDTDGDYTRRVVTCSTSDPLRHNFTGWEARRIDSGLDFEGKARVFSTIVANAAQYYGIRPLAQAASLGDFQIKADSAFSQLLPSAQIESPIVDLSATGINVGQVATGTTISYAHAGTFSTATSLALGAGIAPGTLSITVGGWPTPFTDDSAGNLLVGGVPVGAVDYENGIASLSSASHNAVGQSFTITYELGVSVSQSLRSDAIAVTLTTRSLSYVTALSSLPAPGTLVISYLSGGKWYVLRDRGDGAVTGAVSGLGAGAVNYVTGSVSMTLGALPDVSSHVILQWALATSHTVLAPDGTLSAGGNAKLLFTGGAVLSEYTHDVTVSWDDGAARSFAWAAGVVTGGGGRFAVNNGVSGIEFDSIPPKGTVVTLAGQQHVTTDQTYAAASTASFTLPQPPLRGSVTIPVVVQQVFTIADHDGFVCTLHDKSSGTVSSVLSNGNKTLTVTTSVVVRDRAGDGVLYFEYVHGYASGQIPCGTVDHATGAVSISTADIAHGAQWPGPSVFGWNAAGAGLGAEWHTFKGTRSAKTTVAAQAASVQYKTGSLAPFNVTRTVDAVVLPVVGAPAGHFISSLSFKVGGTVFRRSPADATLLVRDPSPQNGAGTAAGSVSATQVTLTTWAANTTVPVLNEVLDFSAVAAKTVDASANVFVTDRLVFRTPNAPLRPGSFTVQGRLVAYAGGSTTAFSVTADANGIINTANLFGVVDYNTGICHLYGRASGTEAAGLSVLATPGWLLSVSGGGGLAPDYTPGLLVGASVSFNAVSYTYLPLDADILGLDPVRLPSDGRVPVFKAGRVVVVHNTQTLLPQTVNNGQTVDCGRTLLARIRVFGNDGLEITSGFTKNLDAGTITFTNVAGMSQPVSIEHRIEDEALCADAQINGQLRLTRPLTHSYPAAGTYVSSALVVGTLQAAAQEAYSQETWTNVWSDSRIGNPLLAQYDDTNNPIVVTNAGAITERWALIFQSSTTFNVVGEEVGQIMLGQSTNDPLTPINPATGVPYFTLPSGGWGTGWVAGNVLRFNTRGANFPLWVARTVRQSPTAAPGTDQVSISVRGDIDQ